MITRKVTRKFAVKKEGTKGTYEAPDILIAFESGLAKQTFTMLEDESITGTAFKNLPLQNVRAIEGSKSVVADVATLPFFLEQLCGAEGIAGVYKPDMQKNDFSFSLASLDGVKTNKYAGLCMNNFMLVSEAENKVKINFDIISPEAEVRDDTSFPSISTAPTIELLHRHLDGTGYFRIGDQANALASGDNITDLKKIEFGNNWNFALDAVNSIKQLPAVSGQADMTLSIQIAEHTTDNYKTWLDARTPLQLEAYWYASAAATLKLQIPNIIITDVVISEDDKGRVDLTLAVGRNGYGTNYDNDNMEFIEPFALTLVNS